MMRVFALLLSFSLSLVLSQNPPRTPQEIAADLRRLATEVEALQTAEPVVVVPQGGNLQAALNAGGNIEFEGTHTAPDRFTVPVSGTKLTGRVGAKLIGGAREAIVVPPSVDNVTLANFQATSNGQESVVRVGANDTTQTTLAQEPDGITLRNIVVPTHRGKRGFEINAKNVLVEDCSVFDTWSTAGADSQGLSIYNSSGNVTVRGGTYQAGSENILVGGDTMKMVGVVPTTLLFDNVRLEKPLSWKTDGVERVVKNLFELKTGRNVTLQNSYLSGSWTDGQTALGIVLTPKVDGQVTNVVVDNNTILNVGQGVQILGRAYLTHTPTRLSATISNNNFTIDHTIMGGTGRLATIEAEPDFVEFTGNTYAISGTSIITYQWGNVMEANGTVRVGGPANRITFTGNTGRAANYGLNFLGYANCGPNKQGFAAATVLEVTGNTLSGAAALFKTNFPNNVWQ